MHYPYRMPTGHRSSHPPYTHGPHPPPGGSHTHGPHPPSASHTPSHSTVQKRPLDQPVEETGLLLTMTSL